MSHGTKRADGIMSEINVVPLVDIVLVLLIIFMVTANFINKPAIDLELPKADTGDRKERNQFSLLLGRDGSAAIGERRVDEARLPDELARQVREFIEQKRQSAAAQGVAATDPELAAAARRELTMVIQADVEVSHGRVIRAIDEARKAGIVKYAFNVDPAALGEQTPGGAPAAAGDKS